MAAPAADDRRRHLSAPLLLKSDPPSWEKRAPAAAAAADVILDIGDADGVSNGVVDRECSSDGASSDESEREEGNPFEFLRIDGPFRPPRPPCPVDPFRNHTPSVEGIYEWVKIVLCLPIAVVRLVLFGICLAVGYVATKVALHGWKDRHNPMPRWRCRIMWITRLCTRCILFSFGYHWIKRLGRPVSRKIAPIVVSNHISYIDPIFFFYELSPTIVASESHDSIPFVGTIIRAMQVIYVDRFSAPSRKHAVSEIKRKASSDGFPRVLLFPEGTTTNGRCLISFQLGAFIPGFPIQPVVIRYPYVHFDQSWGHISLSKLMFRMFTQFHNFMEVEYLPIIFPSENKQESATKFAEQASHAITSALNVVQTSHSYGDLMLCTRASQLTKCKPSAYMVEMAWVESSFNISTSKALEFLDKFLAMNPDSNGQAKLEGFLNALKLGPPSPLSKKIFDFIDADKKGSITFRQFLLGSAHLMQQPSFHQCCEAIFNECKDGDYFSIQKVGEVFQAVVPDVSNETICEQFGLLDVDEDGLISKKDFVTSLRKNPLLIAVFHAQLRRNNRLDAV